MGARDETASIGVPHDEGPLRAVVTAPRGTTTVILPVRGRVRIGRAPECEIVIDDDSVSRVHCTLHLDPAISIADAGSRNGTIVLGQRLGKEQRWPLPIRSVVQIGRALLVLQRGPAPAEPAGGGQLVIESPAMRRLYDQIPVFAASPLPILVLGESGVGKDVFARAVHERSPRARGPFIAINCAALPDALLESELFGHVKGAFTGAAQAKVGLLQAAHQGTMFLDEVAELPLLTQAKLLRVLESGEVTPLGAVRPVAIDVRFMAATNRDLRAMVETGRMREDLYFRLDGMTATVPPLRERPEDVARLAVVLVAQAAARLGRSPPSFDDAVLATLLDYAWPGNVRELRNVVERAVALAQGDPVLRPQHIQLRFADRQLGPPSIAPPPAMPRASETAQGDERQRILDALLRASGNQTIAAKLLGMSRRTLIRRIELFGISRPRKDAPP